MQSQGKGHEDIEVSRSWGTRRSGLGGGLGFGFFGFSAVQALGLLPQQKQGTTVGEVCFYPLILESSQRYFPCVTRIKPYPRAWALLSRMDEVYTLKP